MKRVENLKLVEFKHPKMAWEIKTKTKERSEKDENIFELFIVLSI